MRLMSYFLWDRNEERFLRSKIQNAAPNRYFKRPRAVKSNEVYDFNPIYLRR